MCIVISWISLIHFIIRRKFFSHLFYIPVCCYTVSSFFFFQSLNSVLLTKLPFLSSFFISRERIQTEEALTHHNHTTPIIYYKTSKWRTATATEDKWNRPSSLRTWKRFVIKRQRRIKVVRARVISSLQNFRKSNQQTLLRRKTNRLFWWTTNNTNTLFSLSLAHRKHAKQEVIQDAVDCAKIVRETFFFVFSFSARTWKVTFCLCLGR